VYFAAVPVTPASGGGTPASVFTGSKIHRCEGGLISSIAVNFTPLDSVRCPAVVDAPTFQSQLANAAPFGNDWSTKVSLETDPIVPPVLDRSYQVATSPKTEG
jgi:hypothetical protein